MVVLVDVTLCVIIWKFIKALTLEIIPHAAYGEIMLTIDYKVLNGVALFSYCLPIVFKYSRFRVVLPVV